VVVARIEPGSQSEEIGLKRGDVLLEIDRQKIKNLNDLNRVSSKIKKGDTVLLFINRGGRRFYATIPQS
ncbi:MAG: PDZ domain-containing protein, partial [Nitrospirae bacterium]|nr:PDZ domain-containing protein [Nitrospirota bacterium]